MASLSQFKVCPVIRESQDRAELWKGLREGLVDCFASDHAPHSIIEKDRPMVSAAHGMISQEYHFMLYLAVREKARLSWAQFYRALFSRPASLLGLKDCVWAPGGRASFVVFDPSQQVNLKWERGLSRNTPFLGMTLKGNLLQHWIRGDCVYKA
jgi:dihydroorotase